MAASPLTRRCILCVHPPQVSVLKLRCGARISACHSPGGEINEEPAADGCGEDRERDKGHAERTQLNSPKVKW